MKKQKLIQAIILLSFSCIKIVAQNSFVASGGEAHANEGMVSYSVGQPLYTDLNNTYGEVFQGVQQPFELFILSTDIKELKLITSAVFPNPTKESIIISVGNSVEFKLSFRLMDLNGAVLLNQNIDSENTSVNVSHLSSGNYFIIITNNSTNEVIKTFKLVKL